MKVPTYRKYGITKRKFDNIKFRNSRISVLLTHEIPLALGVILGIVFWVISYRKLNPSGFLETAGQIFLFATMGVICIGIPMLIFKGIEKMYYAWLAKNSDVYRGTLKYEADREKFNYWKIRRDESYWKLLDGLSFEYEVLNVFSQIGYEFKSSTSVEDIRQKFILENNNEKYLLLCKTGKGNSDFANFINSSGFENIHKTIIVSPHDFSSDFIEEARGKPIKLVSAKELIELVKTIKE